jgi:hypothetical protein
VPVAAAELARSLLPAGGRGRSRPPAPLTTPGRLRRLLAGLLAVTVVLWITATVLLQGQHSTAVTVRETSFPAYLDAVEARAALADADRAAWQSFRSGAAQLTGPGAQYQDDITTAGQDLEELAALVPASGSASQQLHTASGQLVSYEALVEQADAANRSDIATGTASDHDLGYAYLTYSASAMRDPQGGLLATINELTAANRQALDRRLASPWSNPALILIFGAADIAMLGALFGAGRFLLRRFRRVVSLPLLLAGVLAVTLLAWIAAVAGPADASLGAARATAVPRLIRIWDQQTGAVDASAAALAANVPSGPAATAGDAAAGQGGGLNVAVTGQASRVVTADLAAAEDVGGLPVGIPLVAIAIAGLAFLGVKLRLDEYRG